METSQPSNSQKVPPQFLPFPFLPSKDRFWVESSLTTLLSKAYSPLLFSSLFLSHSLLFPSNITTTPIFTSPLAKSPIASHSIILRSQSNRTFSSLSLSVFSFPSQTPPPERASQVLQLIAALRRDE